MKKNEFLIYLIFFYLYNKKWFIEIKKQNNWPEDELNNNGKVVPLLPTELTVEGDNCLNQNEYTSAGVKENLLQSQPTNREVTAIPIISDNKRKKKGIWRN